MGWMYYMGFTRNVIFVFKFVSDVVEAIVFWHVCVVGCLLFFVV